MRNALGSLPWVEHGTIQTDPDRREVRFNLKGAGGFNLEEVKTALKGQGFPEVAVKSAPP